MLDLARILILSTAQYVADHTLRQKDKDAYWDEIATLLALSDSQNLEEYWQKVNIVRIDNIYLSGKYDRLLFGSSKKYTKLADEHVLDIIYSLMIRFEGFRDETY